MSAVKQNLSLLMTWLGCLAFAFATLTEIRSYSRNEPSMLAGGAQTLKKLSIAAQAAYTSSDDVRQVSRR